MSFLALITDLNRRNIVGGIGLIYFAISSDNDFRVASETFPVVLMAIEAPGALVLMI